MKNYYVDNAENRIDFLDERFYKKDGEYYPSVTQVLGIYPKGQHFEKWLKENGFNADKIKNEAAEVGSNVHNAIERYLLGETVDWVKEGYTEEEWKMVNRFTRFDELFQPTIDRVEAEVVDKEMGVGGTIDLICGIDGQRWLIDHKTSKEVSNTHKIQLAVYQKMWENITGQHIERVGILHLRSRTRTEKDMQGVGWRVHEVEDIDHYLRLWNYIKAIYDEERNDTPKLISYPIQIKRDENKTL